MTHPPAAPAPAPAAGLRREWQAPFAVDVRLILSVHRRGGRDPAYRVDAAGSVWRTSLTPDGPGTLRVAMRQGTLVTGQAWGPGATWLLDTLPAQLGAHDDLSGFTARHPIVAELALRYPGLRVGRTGRLFEALARQNPMVLVFEDLHWADDAMLDFIDHLVEWASDVPLLVVAGQGIERAPRIDAGEPDQVQR